MLYISFLSIFDYYDKNSSLPDLNNNTQADEIMEKAKKLYDEFSKLSKNGKNDLFKGVVTAQLNGMKKFLIIYLFGQKQK